MKTGSAAVDAFKTNDIQSSILYLTITTTNIQLKVESQRITDSYKY